MGQWLFQLQATPIPQNKKVCRTAIPRAWTSLEAIRHTSMIEALPSSLTVPFPSPFVLGGFLQLREG